MNEVAKKSMASVGLLTMRGATLSISLFIIDDWALGRTVLPWIFLPIEESVDVEGALGVEWMKGSAESGWSRQNGEPLRKDSFAVLFSIFSSLPWMDSGPLFSFYIYDLSCGLSDLWLRRGKIHLDTSFQQGTRHGIEVVMRW
jgi:hypothetical protein